MKIVRIQEEFYDELTAEYQATLVGMIKLRLFHRLVQEPQGWVTFQVTTEWIKPSFEMDMRSPVLILKGVLKIKEEGDYVDYVEKETENY